MKKLLFLMSFVLGGVAVLRLLTAGRRARLREILSGIRNEGVEVQASTPAPFRGKRLLRRPAGPHTGHHTRNPP